MRASKTKALLSIIATLTSGVLALVYWLAPVDATSHRLHLLLIDCIPDAVIVLIAIPIVYWLFYRRGLTNMGDCPLFSEDREVTVADRSPHSCETSAPPVPWANGMCCSSLIPSAILPQVRPRRAMPGRRSRP